jgi:succinylarginine dihydrolase
MSAFEVNFDGLVGPTHNYGGLSYGNVASVNSAQSVSRPKAAAKQGLEKMKVLADMGIRQAVLPPQERPHVETLRRIGFTGTDAEVIRGASRAVPEIFQACCSASSMWAANAATVAPSADTADARVHFTPANLCSKFHRSLEYPITGRVLRAVFSDETRFAFQR